jgi:hypothetical protein
LQPWASCFTSIALVLRMRRKRRRSIMVWLVHTRWMHLLRKLRILI